MVSSPLLGVDVGEVVTGVAVAVAAQREAAAVTPTRYERGREAAVRDWEADADVAPPVVTVRRVDADVDRFVGVGERTDPAAHDDRLLTAVAVARVIVSMRLRTPRNASRWFIGTLAWPSGRATSVR